MSASQAKAVARYRNKLTGKGLGRFEVLGRDADRALIRAIARVMAEDDSKAMSFRASITEMVHSQTGSRGAILAGLRRAPLLGGDMDLSRSQEAGRNIEF